MKHRKIWSTFFAVLLAVTMVLGQVQFAFADETKYTVEENAADGFFKVTNPDGTILTLADTAILLEVDVDGVTHAFKDLNGNGSLDVYEDYRNDETARAQDLVAQLSIEEIYPLLLYSMHQGMGGGLSADLTSVMDATGVNTTQELLELGLRALLNASASTGAEDTIAWTNAVQAYAEANGGFGIPVNISSDPRSNAGASDSVYDGSQSAVSKWPGNLGLAATFDPQITEQHGRITGAEYRALGITTALSPQIDLATEPRWVRVDGTFGESAQLTADMNAAYVLGFQSTKDADGNDVWGNESVAVMLKHWPGDGSGEGGRESHAKVGKYAVYPGGKMDEAISTFDSALVDVSGTQLAAAIMPSYSVAIDGDGNAIGEAYGSGLSAYKMQDLLRDARGFDGIVCTDWGVGGVYKEHPDGTYEGGGGMVWGAEDMDAPERIWMGIAGGLDMYGGLSAPSLIKDAHHYALETLSVPEADADLILRTAATRVLVSALRLGLFESAFVSTEDSLVTLTLQSSSEAGYEAQQKSIVMLKNEDGVIAASDGEKKTVYIPMKDAETLMYDEAAANEKFNVVTDTVEGETITRLTDFTDVDFALVKIQSPENIGNYFTGYGIDWNLRNVPGDEDEMGMFGPGQLAYREGEPIDNGYIPMTLQYRPYTADPEVVREKPIAVDPKEEEQWIAAGGEAEMSRYYGGKTVSVLNESDLDIVLEVAENAGDVPVIVNVAMANAMCFYEFEAEVEGIIVSFDTSDRAILDIVSGDVEPTGLLPMQMPADMITVEQQLEDVAFDMECHVDEAGNAYDFAFGLNWSGVIDDARVAQYGNK